VDEGDAEDVGRAVAVILLGLLQVLLARGVRDLDHVADAARAAVLTPRTRACHFIYGLNVNTGSILHSALPHFKHDASTVRRPDSSNSSSLTGLDRSHWHVVIR
jgi:hypothetical protein